MRRFCWMVVVGCLGLGGVVRAQGTTVVELPVPLLPQVVDGVGRTGDAAGGQDAAQADAAAADVLREDGLLRFARAQYGPTSVEALQFGDASGARAAFSFYRKAGGRAAKDNFGAQESAVVGERTVVLAQTVVLIAEKDAQSRTLNALVAGLPKLGGPRSQPPLLPTFFPAKGLVNHSVRYAVGPAGYAAMGGTLQAGKLGWEKSAEAAIAEYTDRRGKETVTLLLYPTPQIAAEHARDVETQVNGQARTRREGELVLVAAGSFSADDAQNLIENIHLRTEVTFDKPMPPEFHAEVQKTFTLLQSIALFSAAGFIAAIVLALFVGGGRAMVRKMQGKDAASEAEFLSLHLDPQNPRPKLGPPGS